MIDLHSHILPGLDDGASTLEESVALARRAVEAGVTAIAATPHVREDYPTTADEMERALAQVSARLGQEGVRIDVLGGGEVALDELDRRPVEELRRFGLGGNPAYLLVESPYYGLPLDFENRLFRLRAIGITPVLAHPERSSDLSADLDLMRRIVAAGTLVQVTADSLAGGGGRRAGTAARTLVESGLAHIIASDSHGPALGRAGLEEAAAMVSDEALAEWLTLAVPTAIVSRTSLPERPSVKRSRLSLRRRA